MASTMTISLPEDLKRQLDELVEAKGLSRSHLVRESLHDYFLVQSFRELQHRLTAEAATGRALSEQAVFELMM